MELKKSSGIIFEHLGFHPAEAEVLKVKAQLVGIARPAFNRLMNNKLEGISVDKMIQMKYKLGLGTEVRTIKIKNPKAA